MWGRSWVRDLFWWGLLPSAVLSLAALTAMYWPVPARVQVEGVVRGITFELGGDREMSLTSGIRFRSLWVQEFSGVTLSFAPRFGQAASLPPNPITVTSGAPELRPTVLLDGVGEDQGETGTLAGLSLKPASQVTLLLHGREMQVTIRGERSYGTVDLPGAFRMELKNCRVEGAGGTPREVEQEVHEGALVPSAPQVSVEGQPKLLSLALQLSQLSQERIFRESLPVGGIPVRAVAWGAQDSAGGAPLSLVETGTITYLDFPRIAAVQCRAPAMPRAERLEHASILELAPKVENQRLVGIAVRMVGTARELAIVEGERDARDCRLKLFDTVMQNGRLPIFGTIFVWVFGVLARVFIFRK